MEHWVKQGVPKPKFSWTSFLWKKRQETAMTYDEIVRHFKPPIPIWQVVIIQRTDYHPKKPPMQCKGYRRVMIWELRAGCEGWYSCCKPFKRNKNAKPAAKSNPLIFDRSRKGGRPK